jgi:hypothetical protein
MALEDRIAKKIQDKRTRLERESHNSNHWHQRLAGGCNGSTETSTETLGELYYRTLRSTYKAIKGMRDKKTTRVYFVYFFFIFTDHASSYNSGK